MIAALIKTWLAPYEVYLWAGLSVALTLGGVYFVHHERAIGKQELAAADNAARVTLDAKVAQQTQALQAKADASENARVATQKALDDYMAAHPIGAVIVCGNPRRSGSGVPKATGPAGDPSSGSSAVSEMPGGDAPRDIGPSLDTIVRAAAAMGGLYRETQEDYLNAQHQR